MKVWIVFCNGSVECAFDTLDKAINYIAKITKHHIIYVANRLEKVGNIDDCYYIEMTNLK